MVIQRIYVQPAATDDLETASKTSNSPARSQRSATVDSYTGNLASTVDPQAAPAAASNGAAVANGSPVALKRTPSTSTSKTGSGTVSRLIAQAAFQKTVDAPSKFHAELERRYANPPSPLDLKELPQKGDGAPRGTFVLPKLRSASAHTPSSSSLLAPPSKITSGSLSASPESSPVATTPNSATPSPKVELQVLELNQQLIDSTVENKTLKAEISNMEKAVMDLQDAHREKTPATTEPPSPKERTVPKAEFDALLKDTEKATKELEEIERKAEERQRELDNLAAQAAKLQSKTKALETSNADPHNAAAKETLEAAVERLREQVESAQRQSVEVSRRNSSSSKISERYGPSSTRVPLAWNRRANATDTSSPPTPTMEKTPLDDAKSVSTVASRTANRRSQVISIAPAEPLPEREDLQRSIKSYYSESVRSPTILSPPLPTINHSDYDGPSTEELSRDINAIVEGFASESFGFDTGALSLTAPTVLAPPKGSKGTVSKATAPKLSTPMSPTKASQAAETQSIRSKRSVSSLKDSSTRGKKKGWISLFKVKLPGGSTIEEDRKSRSSMSADKPPVLAPISQSTPLSISPA
ncbi:hypothetical protein FS837_000796 [Tulasnella sp. UAMH 9824]|nr:hypothetical protein FS837_000796 [Tulasnella sp. UAMH 9824]